MSHRVLGQQFRLFHGGPPGLSEVDARINPGANTPEAADEPLNYSTTNPAEAASYAAQSSGAHGSVYEVEHIPGDIWVDDAGSERLDQPAQVREKVPQTMEEASEYLSQGGGRWLAFSHESPLRVVREMSQGEAQRLGDRMGVKRTWQ